MKCLGVPTPAIAFGTANQQSESADSGYMPFWPRRVRVFRLLRFTRFIWDSLVFTMHFVT